MNKKLSLVIVILAALALVNSAMALAPMGTPTAGLKTGQFRTGFDYFIGQEDIEADYGGSYGSDIYKDVQSNLFAANIGYGVCDDWEVFVRLGAADASFDEYKYESTTYDWEVGGDYGFLIGLGTKVTFLKQENLNWGALFQIHWWNSEDSSSGSYEGEGTVYWTEKLELDIYEIQVAVGPTWKVNEALSIYGGPFFQFIGGDADYCYTEDGVPVDTDSGDLKEESCFGGYVGAQWDLDPSRSVYAEFQFTGDALGFGTGIGWKF